MDSSSEFESVVESVAGSASEYQSCTVETSTESQFASVIESSHESVESTSASNSEANTITSVCTVMLPLIDATSPMPELSQFSWFGDLEVSSA